MTTAQTTAPTADATIQVGPRIRSRWNWPLLLIAAYMAPVGFQAAVFPRSFFEDFPGGRGWIVATGGEYNEHLVRDVGVLFVALIIVTVWTGTTRTGDRAAAVGWIVQGAAHFVFHIAHLHDLAGFDRVSLLGSLAVVPVLAALGLVPQTVWPSGWTTGRSPEVHTHQGPDAGPRSRNQAGSTAISSRVSP